MKTRPKLTEVAGKDKKKGKKKIRRNIFTENQIILIYELHRSKMFAKLHQLNWIAMEGTAAVLRLLIASLNLSAFKINLYKKKNENQQHTKLPK